MVVVAATQNCDDAERAEYAEQDDRISSVIFILIFKIVNHELEDEDGTQS